MDRIRLKRKRTLPIKKMLMPMLPPKTKILKTARMAKIILQMLQMMVMVMTISLLILEMALRVKP